MHNLPRSRRTFLKTAASFGAVAAGWSLNDLAAIVAPKGVFRVVQLCDTQLGFGGYEHDVRSFSRAVKQINALKPDFTVICGDLVNRADEKSFADFNRIKTGLDAPCYCVPGNHDVGNTPTERSLQFYRETVGLDHFTVQHKGFSFLFVNTQLWKVAVKGESDKHDAWFRAALKEAARKRLPSVIVGHYPLFLKKPDEKEEYYNLPLAKRTELLQLFADNGVVAVLGGHTHRLIRNEYRGIQLLNGETTSRNFDKRPLGFRAWKPGKSGGIPVEFIPLSLP